MRPSAPVLLLRLLQRHSLARIEQVLLRRTLRRCPQLPLSACNLSRRDWSVAMVEHDLSKLRELSHLVHGYPDAALQCAYIPSEVLDELSQADQAVSLRCAGRGATAFRGQCVDEHVHARQIPLGEVRCPCGHVADAPLPGYCQFTRDGGVAKVHARPNGITFYLFTRPSN